MIVMPNMLVVLASFLTKDETWYLRLPLNLDNYRALFDTNLWMLIAKSIGLALCTGLACLLIGYPFAYLIAKLPKERHSIFLMLIMIPFWTNSLVRNYALVSVFSDTGLINQWLLNLGLIKTPIHILHTNFAVFFGMTYTLLPFMILPIYAVLEKIDRSLVEAARDLGANSFDVFKKIIIPLSFSGIVAGFIMVFLPALTLFYVSDILGGSKVLVLGSVIRNYFLPDQLGALNANWPVGAAISVSLTLSMLVLLTIYFKSGNTVEEEQQLW
ncbi:MAG: ABC transporter permease subunit [Alphaproteobacteria bacterium]|nr:ABC transporter permease subunit [Alphaproteobacteria bacterium]